MPKKTHFLQNSGCLFLADASEHQNFVRNGFLTFIWPKYHDPSVKHFGHDGRNKSVLRLGLLPVMRVMLLFSFQINIMNACVLRLEDTYGAKIRPPCKFPIIILLLNHLSETWGTTFWPSGQGCQKYIYIWKVTSRFRAEIKSIQ